MLYRKAYDRLLQWKQNKNKTALCIQGARQIGKTTVVREFGKNEYKCFVEFNFVSDLDARKIFDGNLDANTIIEGITALSMKQLIPGDTLILFDEIQECPNARTAIKFLVEDGRFDYIETGSLLGVKNKIVRSLPVGFEELYTMYPMDFEEFILANGLQQSTVDSLRKSYEEKTPILDVVHTTLTKLFNAYIVVGGMPKVVKTYIDTHDITRVIASQNEIIELYRQDIAKYADASDRPKIRSIFDSIPSQLNDKNRRFIISSQKTSARMERYEDSFNWLLDAGVANACFNVSEPVGALKLNEKRNLFKLYAGDTGLLCALSMDNIQFSILNNDLTVNMGSILENVMAQMFVANNYSLHYFDTKKIGEIDFVLQNGSKIDFVEIKSGNDYKKHHTLDRLLEIKEWEPDSAIVFCKDNVQCIEKITYYPWYMAMFLKSEFIENMTYKVDLDVLNSLT